MDRTVALEVLLDASGGSRSDVAAAVRRIGAAELAGVLVDELCFRCGVVDVPGPIAVSIDVVAGPDRTTTTLALAPGRPAAVADPPDGPAALHLTFDATDLVTALFGTTPTGDGLPATTHVGAAHPCDGRPVDFAAIRSASVAIDRIADACSRRAPDLGRLAVTYGSDKWGALHRFAPHYEFHLGPLRHSAVTVLEIGVGGYGSRVGGGSLKMWKRWFRRGRIIGLDVYDKSSLDEPRITTVVGDQGSPADLRAIAERHGPFDVVIDDGSHLAEHVHTTFRSLFPAVRPGGIYVVEDLWTAFCPGYGGDERLPSAPHTSLGMVKTLVDDLHHEEWPSTATDGGTGLGASLTGLHVYHNIAFLQRGVNAEGPIPPWVPRSLDALMPEAADAPGTAR